MQHLDEGTIHAWLDDELSPEEVARAEAHVAECSECAALVAEARGLIAASTRILIALDDVPSRVVPGKVPARMRHWYDRTDIRATAVLLFVAGGSLVVVTLARNSAPAVQARAAAEEMPPLASTSEDTVASVPSESAQQQKKEARSNTNKPIVAVPQRASSRLEAAAPKAVPSLDEARVSGSGVAARSMSVTAAPPVVLQKPADSTSLVARGAMRDFARAESVSGRIEGRVTDAQRAAGIGGATVSIQGTNLGASTDKDGLFRIDNVPAGEQRLIVRRIGYAAKTVPVSMNERVAMANITMAPSELQLSGGVVTGIGDAAKVSNAPASIAVTSASTSLLRQVRADSSGSIHRTVYEVASGVQVTLVEAPMSFVSLGGSLEGKQSVARKAAAIPVPATVNVIEWTDGNRQYTLTGPLTKPELETIKARLMKMRQ